MMASPVAQTYLSYLKQQGINAHIDFEGDVVFKIGPLSYYIDIDADDTKFLRIVFPNFKEINNRKELIKAIEAAHSATRKTKVAKVWVHPDNKRVSASIEMFLPEPGDIEVVFQRALSALMAAVTNFLGEF